MQSRRTFLQSMIASLGFLHVCGLPAIAAQQTAFKGEHVFHRIMARATAEKWSDLPIGDLMGKIAKELEGTPYIANTLELSSDHEICSVNLTGLDCVTFFETTLCFARMLKKGGKTAKDLLAEVNFTRYRGGTAGDYSTRLHYTSDWFADNESKGVVKLLSQLPGAQAFPQKVGFMSSHVDSYPQLVAHPELVASIVRSEKEINNRSLSFMPMDKITAVEPLLRTGDIVGVCTSMPGMDISHTGLVYCDQNGMRHFMDASSRKSAMKVTIEPGPIGERLNWSKNLTGAMFARPLEPMLPK